MKNIDLLLYWVKERYSIFEKKGRGEPPPWTSDPILRTYRFCNVHRENDTVTKWIAENWRIPNSKDEHLWFAMVVSRLFNLPETLKSINYPIPYYSPAVKNKLVARRSAHNNVFNAAYIVSTNGKAMDKIEYICDYVLQPMWNDRDWIKPKSADTLESFGKRLQTFNGMGSFMTGQVIADLKYAQLQEAADWHTFAVPGPGSLRGMRRLNGLDVKDTSLDKQWKKNLLVTMDMINDAKIVPMVHAQDTQNCLCEFDKFLRVKNGEGAPKQIYRGGR